MSSAYENAMSDLQANNYTQKYPVTDATETTTRAVCPVCHKMVATFHDQSMTTFFTRHQNTNGKWCDRSGKKAK